MAQPNPSRAPSDPRRTSTLQKRTSILPRPSTLTIDDTVLIAQHASLTGSYPITLAPDVVLHPHAKISSALAPVVVEEGCVVHERARVGVWSSDGGNVGAYAGGGIEGVKLGKWVVVETNAIIEASEIGQGSEIGVGVSVGRGCVIGKVCASFPSTFPL
jgi:dynactin-6